MTDKINSIASVAQMRLLASSRLPKAVFDFIDGGAEDENTVRANTQDYSRYSFVPRVLRDVAIRKVATTVLGETYSMPVGIAPTGLAGLAWPHAERLLMNAATACDIPFTLGAMASCDLEEIAALSETHRWFQLYALKDLSVTQDLLQRAQQSGFTTLLVTVDVPVVGKRERDLVNGFTVPLKWSPRMCWDMLSHPQWSLATLRAGAPTMKVLARYTGVDTQSVAAHSTWVNNAFEPAADWQYMQRIRDLWPGKLLIKGVLACEDADRAVKLGVDGLVISNHGGRQLDGAISSVRALDQIAKHLDGKLPLLLDSGVRRGSDVVKALCLGASMVLVGRATLYGAAAGQQHGVERVLTILREEINRTLALIGVDDINKLDRKYLTINND